MEHQETSLRVAYALHSSLDGLAYLQRVAQLIRLEASPRDQALR